MPITVIAILSLGLLAIVAQALLMRRTLAKFASVPPIPRVQMAVIWAAAFGMPWIAELVIRSTSGFFCRALSFDVDSSRVVLRLAGNDPSEGAVHALNGALSLPTTPTSPSYWRDTTPEFVMPRRAPLGLRALLLNDGHLPQPRSNPALGVRLVSLLSNGPKTSFAKLLEDRWMRETHTIDS